LYLTALIVCALSMPILAGIVKFPPTKIHSFVCQSCTLDPSAAEFRRRRRQPEACRTAAARKKFGAAPGQPKFIDSAAAAAFKCHCSYVCLQCLWYRDFQSKDAIERSPQTLSSSFKYSSQSCHWRTVGEKTDCKKISVY